MTSDDEVRKAAEEVLRLVAVARRGGEAGLAAAGRLTDRLGPARDLLAAVVEAERAGRATDAEIGSALGVTGHAVTQRFPPANRRRRGRRPARLAGEA